MSPLHPQARPHHNDPTHPTRASRKQANVKRTARIGRKENSKTRLHITDNAPLTRLHPRNASDSDSTAASTQPSAQARSHSHTVSMGKKKKTQKTGGIILYLLRTYERVANRETRPTNRSSARSPSRPVATHQHPMQDPRPNSKPNAREPNQLPKTGQPDRVYTHIGCTRTVLLSTCFCAAALMLLWDTPGLLARLVWLVEVLRGSFVLDGACARLLV
ncbi:uncharacterized protein IWZ02DRAFT_167669 [Phyllosticta citriasiana]|uniref:uncharacterized protein n=1 Tax=Phyllosticta citriasiana TaxID=595635 RepID=UPI0030FD67E5